MQIQREHCIMNN